MQLTVFVKSEAEIKKTQVCVKPLTEASKINFTRLFPYSELWGNFSTTGLNLSAVSYYPADKCQLLREVVVSMSATSKALAGNTL
jgi:hypothetical protein